MADYRDLCGDCETRLLFIRLSEANPSATETTPPAPGSVPAPLRWHYAGDQKKRILGRSDSEGNVLARMCPECGRITLYGERVP